MKLSDFDYELPKELIAQVPLENREDSRLMIINRQSWQILDKHFFDIFDCLWENDVLVVNNTRVINARLKWHIIDKDDNLNNSEIEIFLHKQISINSWDCLVYPWRKLKIWKKVIISNHLKEKDLVWIIKEVSESWRIVEFNIWWQDFLDIVDNVWHTPLPPYIKEKLKDKERYQTVFNKNIWSVAAPTAWLHFSKSLIEKLKYKWVIFEEVLLNVWLWTFKWVESENILEHKMHKEYIELDKQTADRLNNYKKLWKRIIAVWTTSVRVLESMANNKLILEAWKKETDIFIYPWYKRKFVDSMITNFHLPKSTLLMLVSSFAWKNLIDEAYKKAIKEKYRFFSFWDAMFIE
mgnify:CR=1 FL=1